MELSKSAILARLRDDRQIELDIAHALAPVFEGADVDDKARLCNIACGMLLDVLASLDTDRARQTLGALAAYAKMSQAAPQNERAMFYGKGL